MRLFGWYTRANSYKATMSAKGRAWLAKASTRDVIKLLAASLLILQVTACAPQVIKEPYPVREVREVYRPIPAEYTDSLPVPELPEGAITCQVLAIGWKEWEAFGETTNEHRSKVGALTKDDGPEQQ